MNVNPQCLCDLRAVASQTDPDNHMDAAALKGQVIDFVDNLIEAEVERVK